MPIWIEQSLAYFFKNQNDKALEVITKTWEQFPEENGNYFLLMNTVRIMTYIGKNKEAIELYGKKSKNEDPVYKIPIFLGLLGVDNYMVNDKASSEKYLNELLIRSEKSPLGSPSFYAASVYAAMNEKDKAIQMLEKAYDNKEVETYWLNVEPLFRSLHDDPRFKSLLRKIGF
jgi:tetratricopeptide (TPR) repeat protein